MPWIRKHWKLLVILVLFTGVGAFLLTRSSEEEMEVVTDTVVRERLVQTVDATGELESVDEVNLSFDISGTIESVLVQVGDEVSPGDLLATLQTTELGANMENARQALAAAEANLSQKNAGSTSQAIEVARASVAVSESLVLAAKVEYENTKEHLENTIAQSAATVDEAELLVLVRADALERVLASNTQEQDEQYNNLVASLKSSMIAVRSSLSDADEVLGVDNTLANNDFEDVLSALDFQALASAEASYKAATKSRDLAEDEVFALTISSTDAQVDAVVVLVEDALFKTADTLLHTRRVLDATAVDTADFTFEELSALKTMIDAARASVQAEDEALQGQLQLIEAKKISHRTAEVNAEYNVSQAEQQLASAQVSEISATAQAQASVRSSEVNVSVREADLLQAEARLLEVQAGPRTVDVAALRAQVRAAEATVRAAEARLARAEIRSTLGGTVTEVLLTEGEQVFEGATVITVQSTQEAFQIVVDVPEADIAKIEIADRAELTFDAFGDDDVFIATVVRINPAEKQIEGVVFYEVTMLLEEDVIPAMRPGMSADVTIITEEIVDALTVPQRSVLRRDGTNYVRIPLGGVEFEERTVELGIRGDGGRVQILDGLAEGEVIITSIRTP